MAYEAFEQVYRYRTMVDMSHDEDCVTGNVESGGDSSAGGTPEINVLWSENRDNTRLGDVYRNLVAEMIQVIDGRYLGSVPARTKVQNAAGAVAEPHDDSDFGTAFECEEHTLT